MATIEKIIRSITEEAEKKAENIKKNYEKELGLAIDNLEKEHIQKLRKTDEEKALAGEAITKKLNYEQRAMISNAENRGKFEFFEELIESAADDIIAMPTEEYSLFLKKILFRKNPEPGSTLLFGKNDTKRLGKDFFNEISKKYNVRVKEGNELYGVVIDAHGYVEKITPQTIINDKKPELMQILGRFEASL